MCELGGGKEDNLGCVRQEGKESGVDGYEMVVNRGGGDRGSEEFWERDRMVEEKVEGDEGME